MAKTPSRTDKKDYVGIEIEFYSHFSNECRFLFAKHPLHIYGEIGSDSSIHPPSSNYDAYELRILTPYKNLRSVMRLLQDYLNKTNAKVNASCGLHVHLDMRNRNAAKAYTNLIAKQDEMYKSIPAHRRDNEFCEPSDDVKVQKIIRTLSGKRMDQSEIRGKILKTFEELNISEYIYLDVIDNLIVRANERQNMNCSDHYDGISANPYITNEYKTLEIRLHEGTVDAREISRWVRYLYEASFGKLGIASKTYIKERTSRYG